MRWTAKDLIAFTFVGLVATFGIALAKNPFVNLVPNLETVVASDPQVTTACQVCHTGTSGGILNSFGQQVKANLSGSSLDWRAIAQLDADNDGFSNGLELGDPNGVWTAGQARPGDVRVISHPARATSRPSSIRDNVDPTTWAVIKKLFR